MEHDSDTETDAPFHPSFKQVNITLLLLEYVQKGELKESNNKNHHRVYPLMH